ncbi:3-oxoadipyl-CoA thiolase [Numidum massiliense]|uniref:3-oxoadipyl-CoA thiolase n=1 Tax=Numidum massiliense TaxID=1522315 RepID=UPI0006D54C32|nr:3-oxoadipyl-CoA thiolase [Numidum massiliense]
MRKEVVIVDAVRTPIGRYRGALKSVRPDDLAALVIRELLKRQPEVEPADVEDVIFGCANQAGEDNRNVARMAGLLAGLPLATGGVTVNRLCGSGLDAVNQAYRALALGEGDVYIGGGTESMTRAPFVMGKAEAAFPRGDAHLFDTTIGWRFINPRLADMYGTLSMPETAEEVAQRFGVSREAQDQFAFASQQKTARAMASGRFADEIVPVEIRDRKGEVRVVDEDEHPRPETTLEKLASLKPLFPDGTVTAGNASGINDGASAVLLMTEQKAAALGVKPLARIVTTAVQGIEPNIMGLGPVGATRKALARAGLTVDDLGLVELNEAFASQSLACIEQLELNSEKVNVNGGAIALGHPLGASGARLLTTLVHEMKKQGVRYGLATMCIGVGQGIATIVEKV